MPPAKRLPTFKRLHFYSNLAIEFHSRDRFQDPRNLGQVLQPSLEKGIMSGQFLIFILFLAFITVASFSYAIWRRREDERKLYSIIQASPIPAFVISKDHKILYWNKALEELSRIKASEVTGTNQHWRAFYKSERPCMADIVIDHPFKKILEFYQGKAARSKLLDEAYESTDFFPDLGERGKWLRITAARIRDLRGNLFGAIETLEDITEQKIAEEELFRRKKQESLGMFADGVAKDFDSLLSAILRNVFLAKISATDEEKILEDGLAIAEKAGLQAKELAHRLITFAKGGYPVRKLERLDPVLRAAAENVLKDSGIMCRISISADLWPAEVDSEQIRRVMENILINAKEAMPEGGTIDLIAENTTIGMSNRLLKEGGSYIKISVRDTGAGIPKENLSKIFDPYFTTKKKKERGGIGLGLAICDSIIKYHNGLIAVESAVNAGTAFYIYIPAIIKN